LERVTFTSLRKRAIAFAVAGLGAAVAAMLSFASALYEAANPQKTPEIAAGETIETGRWDITLREARFVEDEGAGSKRRLAVEMDLTNLSEATSNSFANLLKLEGGPSELRPPAYYLQRDAAIAFDLHPDMTERVIAIWEWPGGLARPENLQLVVAGQFHKKRDNLYGAPGWFDKPPVATVSLPVRLLQPAAAQ
jgi:hypothetical protein